MSSQSNAIHDAAFETPAATTAAISPSQRMYWLVRRELWENRSIYIAPLTIGGLFLLGFLISTVRLPQQMRHWAALGLEEQHKALLQHYMIGAGLMMLTSLVIGVFYCLDALYSERRDRSVLFWKSLPVSDVTTVLSKLITPVIILPLVSFAVAVMMQWFMLLVSTAVLLANGLSATALWSHAAVLQTWPILLYHLLTVHGLWYAPLYGWLLVVSAWSRRAPFLWASLPLLAVVAVEKIALNTTHFGMMLVNRLLGGGGPDHFTPVYFSLRPLSHFNPGEFFLNPGLWVGLALTAAFIAVAVRLRRSQGPV